MAMIMLILLCIITSFDSGNASGNVITASNPCTCPSQSLMYECTVMGRAVGSTVWRGSAFNCTSQEIILLHRHFDSVNGAYGICNNGSIVAQSVRVNNGHYTSRLTVTFNSDLIGKSVECIHDDIVNITYVGARNIVYLTDSFLPPKDLHFSMANIPSKQIEFNWSTTVSEFCPSLHYTILSSNCGSCPTTTTNTTVTCTDVPTNGSVCTFAVRSVVCGTAIGNISYNNMIRVVLKENGHTYSDTQYHAIGYMVSTYLLAVALAVCLSIFIILGIRKRQRKRVRQAVNREGATPHDQSVSSTALNTKRNMAYNQVTPQQSEPVSAAIGTKKNEAYNQVSI